MQLLNGKRQSVKATSLSGYDKGVRKMDDVLETKSLFWEGFPLRRYGSVKACQNEAVRVISRLVTKEFTHRRARAISEGKAGRIDAQEKDAFRIVAQAEKQRTRDEAREIIEEHRREQIELRARLAALDERLASVDQDFHEPSLAALRAQEGGLGRVHLSRNDGEVK